MIEFLAGIFLSPGRPPPKCDVAAALFTLFVIATFLMIRNR